MSVIAIDPGKKGAVAVVSKSRVAQVSDTPADALGVIPDELFDLLCEYKRKFSDPVTHVLIEDVHAMPKQGVSSTFAFGEAYGVALGVAGVLGYPMVRVRPQAWQKLFGIGKDTKADAASVAARLFPACELYGPKGGLKDGRADALLLAEYGLRTLGVA